MNNYFTTGTTPMSGAAGIAINPHNPKDIAIVAGGGIACGLLGYGIGKGIERLIIGHACKKNKVATVTVNVTDDSMKDPGYQAEVSVTPTEKKEDSSSQESK